MSAGAYILIVLYFSSGAPAIAMQEFSSAQTCQAAAASVMAQQAGMKGFPQNKAVCQPK